MIFSRIVFYWFWLKLFKVLLLDSAVSLLIFFVGCSVQ